MKFVFILNICIVLVCLIFLIANIILLKFALLPFIFVPGGLCTYNAVKIIKDKKHH